MSPMVNRNGAPMINRNGAAQSRIRKRKRDFKLTLADISRLRGYVFFFEFEIKRAIIFNLLIVSVCNSSCPCVPFSKLSQSLFKNYC